MEMQSIGTLEEDKQIEILLADAKTGDIVMFAVETEEKADRYLDKMGRRVRVLKREHVRIPCTCGTCSGEPADSVVVTIESRVTH